ncbi:MAG: aminoacyl-tRNA hydrolase [Gammaproteobacteria bacterium]|nr:aminoacyl-tRNA hydrolase [Gammaproteobacteria bacterium]MCH9764089.1 aminoacyl-tRNA hydrolase [Gammaproteobacteria bacterium]
MAIKLVVGLQNPGASYERTRHNAGGWFARALAEHLGATFRLHKTFHGEFASADLNGQPFYILLPNTWMNQSGRSVRALSQFYRIEPEAILVAHDELDLPIGEARLKTGGGHGGHNGLRDLIAHAGGANFHRLRLGIGHPGHKDLVHDYVLGKPSVDDRQKMNRAIDRAIDVMPDVILAQFSAAKTTLHTKQAIEKKEE